MHEADCWDDNCFLTLTFDEQNLPYDGSIRVSHIQKFMKKLRKRYVPKNPYKKGTPEYLVFRREKAIRFFACGEYGEKTMRPHYHVLLFNHDFHDKELWRNNDDGRLWTSKSLDRLWPFGFSSLGRVSFHSAAYVARYAMKKVTGQKAAEHYAYTSKDGRTHQRRPEFLTMSRYPGIGRHWLEKFQHDVFPRDQIVVNGVLATPPRYYTAQLRTDSSNGQLSSIASRVTGARKRKAKAHEADNTPERLAVREKVTTAKFNLKNREL